MREYRNVEFEIRAMKEQLAQQAYEQADQGEYLPQGAATLTCPACQGEGGYEETTGWNPYSDRETYRWHKCRVCHGTTKVRPDMVTTCTHCSGSGDEPDAPANYLCSECNGLGYLLTK